MPVIYNICVGLAVVVTVLFSALVLITGKGDAMSGSGGIRTSFKGKASFDDYMSRMTLFLGIGFFALMIIIDALSNKMVK